MSVMVPSASSAVGCPEGSPVRPSTVTLSFVAYMGSSNLGEEQQQYLLAQLQAGSTDVYGGDDGIGARGHRGTVTRGYDTGQQAVG
jgi:hypothetical protein